MAVRISLTSGWHSKGLSLKHQEFNNACHPSATTVSMERATGNGYASASGVYELVKGWQRMVLH